MKVTENKALFQQVARLSEKLNYYVCDPLNCGQEIPLTAKKFGYVLGKSPEKDFCSDIAALNELVRLAEQPEQHSFEF